MQAILYWGLGKCGIYFIAKCLHSENEPNGNRITNIMQLLMQQRLVFNKRLKVHDSGQTHSG